MFTNLVSLIPALLLTITPILATPTPITNLARQDQYTAMATIISYFVATDCNSPYDQATQTIGSNSCLDLGEDDTTRSVGFYNLAVESGDVVPNCVVRVWENETCSSGSYVEVELGAEGSDDAGKTCVEQPTWSDNTTVMGSLMLVCQ